MIVKLELPNARTTNGKTAYITGNRNKGKGNGAGLA